MLSRLSRVASGHLATSTESQISGAYASLLRSFIIPKALPDGRLAHHHIIKGNPSLATLLIQFYNSCGASLDALALFSKPNLRNLPSWNFTLHSHAREGKYHEVLQLFDIMLQEGVIPNEITFVCSLSVCGGLAALVHGTRMHTRIIERGFGSNVIVATALLTMYGKCLRPDIAWKVFDMMPERNVVAWTAMISMNAQQGLGEEALCFFSQMQCQGTLPDRVTYLNVLAACALVKTLAVGKRMHAHIMKGDFILDIAVSTALLNMYGKCGALQDAKKIFNSLYERNTVSWTILITLSVEHGQGVQAIQLFQQMLREGILPDKVTFVSLIATCTSPTMLVEGMWMHALIINSGLESHAALGNALVNMYGKCGSLIDAERVFCQMHERDVVSWTTMISVFVEHGVSKKALQLYEQMQYEGVIRDRVTSVSILAGCAGLEAIITSKKLHLDVLSSGHELDLVLGNALISLYSKHGNITLARRIFDSMQELDVVSWNAMIAAYAYHGSAKEALWLFEQMRQRARVKPDNITFMSILVACSHAGLVRDGWNTFTSMSRDYGVPPAVDHYVCMFDLLTRAGWLDEAEYLVVNMPYQPLTLSFTTLLGACKHQTDLGRADRASRHVFELDPESAASYVTLSNTYAHAGKER